MIKTIDSNGMTMKYFRFGDPSAQPLVIIPGVALKSVMLSAQMIAAQYNTFSDIRNVYVFDRREDMPQEYTIYNMAEDTAKAMDELSIKNADIYGVSQGGMIAQVIAAKRPDLVRRLVLCSTAPYIPDMSRKVLGDWINCSEKGDVLSLVMSFADNIYTKPYREKYHDAFVKFSELVTDEELSRFLITVRGCEGFDIREQLDSIKCPVLVIGAEEDRIFGAEPSHDIAERTNGELYIYSGEAHGVYDENEDVIRRLKAFLCQQ